MFYCFNPFPLETAANSRLGLLFGSVHSGAPLKSFKNGQDVGRGKDPHFDEDAIHRKCNSQETRKEVT